MKGISECCRSIFITINVLGLMFSHVKERTGLWILICIWLCQVLSWSTTPLIQWHTTYHSFSYKSTFLLGLLLMILGEGIGKGLINRAFGEMEKGKWIEGASQIELEVGSIKWLG